MGLDVFQVQDILEEKGIFEENVNLVLDASRNPAFINPLKIFKPKPMPAYGF